MAAPLDPADRHMVLINTFTVDPAKADQLVQVLVDATEKVMKNMPGFVSANLHVSEDRTRVVNYAQWRSKADFEAMRTNPEAGPHMKEAADLANGFEPVIYDLRYSES
jgi:quinol monooxygenase YgiN